VANEVTYASLLSNGGRIAAILAAALHVNLYDSTSLRGLLEFRERVNGSIVGRVTTVTRGLDFAAASSETSGGASNTALTTGYYDLTIARYLKQMQPTDLMAISGDGGAGINTPLLLSMLLEGLDLTITNLLALAFPNLSTSVGTSGADLTVSNFFSAKYALNLAYNGPGLACVLHPQQVNDLEASIRGEGGAMQYRQDAQMMLNAKATGYVGSFLGVDIYQSGRVPTANAGADRCGAMFSRGCFAYTLGNISEIMGAQLVNPADMLVATPEIFIERKRDADNAMTTYIANMYPAVAEAEDVRGVKIVTDA
jgi:hypothetical protein